MAPRKKLTLSDLKPAMAEAAEKPAPAPEPIPLSLAPGEKLEIAKPECSCQSPLSCLFCGMPIYETPRAIHRGCPYATGGDR